MNICNYDTKCAKVGYRWGKDKQMPPVYDIDTSPEIIKTEVS